MSGKDESNLIKILRNTPKVIVSQSLFGRFDIHYSQRYKLQTFIEDMNRPYINDRLQRIIEFSLSLQLFVSLFLTTVELSSNYH